MHARSRRRRPVLSVTDHDTVAGCAEAAAACTSAGIEFVPGIEITAIVEKADVHVLGYFVDVESPGLLAFLAAQRRARIDRVRQMVDRSPRTASRSMPTRSSRRRSPTPRARPAGPGSRARWWREGHVADASEAFARWLGRGRPAFVPRKGPSPAEVFARIHEAGGVSSLAHPVLTGHDEWIPAFAREGLDALEVYHSDHDAEATRRYLGLARELTLAVTGGSDFHGDPSHGPVRPGAVSLPEEDYDRLVRLAASRARQSGESVSS